MEYKRNLASATVAELVLTALFAKNPESLVRRLSLCDLNLESLINGIPVAVRLKEDTLEDFKKYLVERSYNKTSVVDSVDSLSIDSRRGESQILISYKYHYTESDGNVRTSSSTHYMSVGDAKTSQFFEIEMV